MNILVLGSCFFFLLLKNKMIINVKIINFYSRKLLRDLAESDHDNAEKVKECLKNGELVPTVIDQLGVFIINMRMFFRILFIHCYERKFEQNFIRQQVF